MMETLTYIKTPLPTGVSKNGNVAILELPGGAIMIAPRDWPPIRGLQASETFEVYETMVGHLTIRVGEPPPAVEEIKESVEEKPAALEPPPDNAEGRVELFEPPSEPTEVT